MDTGQILADILVGGELRIHLIGVAGSGMSGLAGLLMALGHHVSGSDKVSTVEVERLQKLGLEFHTPHTAESVADADLVIFSSAIRPGNVGYDEAIRTGKSMVRRADALAAIMHCKKGILVAGMHGKTTTSAMAAHVLRGGGLKPSHYVGAEIPILGTNAHWDADGEHFVVEGDESDGTVVLYHPEHAIILNIEEEHLDHYDDLAAIEAVFQQVLEQTRDMVVFCADDPHGARLCAGHPGAISCGASADARYQYRNLESRNFQSHFDVFRDGEKLGRVTLNVPGRHNVSNALCVIALATELGVSFDAIRGALDTFRGAKRRFQITYRSDKFLVVDDYAHHPSEIAATLATARDGGDHRLLVMFQPHRYTRTQRLRDLFATAFADATELYVADIYPASETPIPGVTGQLIVDAVAESGHPAAFFEPARENIARRIGQRLQAGDMVLSLGAGNIHEQTETLARDLALAEEIQAAMGEGSVRLYDAEADFVATPANEAAHAAVTAFCKVRGLTKVAIENPAC